MIAQALLWLVKRVARFSIGLQLVRFAMGPDLPKPPGRDRRAAKTASAPHDCEGAQDRIARSEGNRPLGKDSPTGYFSKYGTPVWMA